MLSMSFKGVRGLPRSPDGSPPSEEKVVWSVQVQHGAQRLRTRSIELACSDKVCALYLPLCVEGAGLVSPSISTHEKKSYRTVPSHGLSMGTSAAFPLGHD